MRVFIHISRKRVFFRSSIKFFIKTSLECGKGDLRSDGVEDPCAMAEDTIECVWESTSAWDVPWNDSNNGSTSGQGAAWVSLADSLSGLSEGANFVGEDERGVAYSVSGLAVSVGQGGGGQWLQLVWWWSSSNSGTSPSRNDGGDTASGRGWGKSDCGNVGIESDDGGGLDDRHIIGDGLGVVASVVDNSGANVLNSTSVQGSGTDNNADRVLSASNGAMGSREHPAVVDDGSATEVEVGSGTERRLERSGRDGDSRASDDSSFTSEEHVHWTCQSNGHEGQDHKYLSEHFAQLLVFRSPPSPFIPAECKHRRH